MSFRWIAYLSQNIPGNQSFRLDRYSSLEFAREEFIAYCNAVGSDDCVMVLYPYSEDDWSLALEFEKIVRPFDYPSKLIERGPRNGVVITNA